MATFLLKTEPSSYSYADLAREKRAVWDGITNNAALAHIRTMRKGDEVFIYHTGDEKAIVGLASVMILAGWRLRYPESFHRLVSGRIWKRWRRWSTYRRPWRHLCADDTGGSRAGGRPTRTAPAGVL